MPFVLLSIVVPLTAQSSLTDPVGWNIVVCPSDSDTVCSVPFSQPITFSGNTGVPVDNSNGTHNLTLNAAPSLVSGSAAAYYVSFTGGNHDGEYYEITNKTLGSTIVVDDRDMDLTNVANDAQIQIKLFWTLSTLFPDGNSTIVASAGNFASQRRTEILIATPLVGSINVAPQETFFYSSADDTWKSTSSGFPNSDNLILWPDSYFIVRHNSLSGPTNYLPSGGVDENSFTIPLFTAIGSSTDNFVSIPRPIDVSLDKLGLGDSAGASAAFVASTGNFSSQRGDELLVFDNAFAAQNKAPSANYFFRSTDNTWRSTTSGFPVADAVKLKSSEGFIIRKKGTDGGQTALWTNLKNW
ncbi:MAG: TIGR02597 family protein [Akkermansiaceae bacterium]|nr:TIGR02597 family protein [Akkermansiaceae bacterium]